MELKSVHFGFSNASRRKMGGGGKSSALCHFISRYSFSMADSLTAQNKPTSEQARRLNYASSVEQLLQHLCSWVTDELIDEALQKIQFLPVLHMGAIHELLIYSIIASILHQGTWHGWPIRQSEILFPAASAVGKGTMIASHCRGSILCW